MNIITRDEMTRLPLLLIQEDFNTIEEQYLLLQQYYLDLKTVQSTCSLMNNLKEIKEYLEQTYHLYSASSSWDLQSMQEEYSAMMNQYDPFARAPEPTGYSRILPFLPLDVIDSDPRVAGTYDTILKSLSHVSDNHIRLPVCSLYSDPITVIRGFNEGLADRVEANELQTHFSITENSEAPTPQPSTTRPRF